MITLTEMLGTNQQPWMDHPHRNCNSPSDAPIDIRDHADQWFPTETYGKRNAAKLCHGCPVILECATYAISDPDAEGIWGGLTETDRKTLRKGAVA